LSVIVLVSLEAILPGDAQCVGGGVRSTMTGEHCAPSVVLLSFVKLDAPARALP
jgi:hypothetical protein